MSASKKIKLYLNVAEYIFLLLVIAAVTWKNLHHLYLDWDAIAYHLPFAGRLLDIYPDESYKFSPLLRELYGGFPLVAEFLQGVLWKLFNNIGAASLIHLLAYMAFCIYLKVRNKISIFVSTVFFFSIPLIFIGFFSSYIDIFVNTFLALGFISLYNYARHKKTADFYLFILFLLIANNSKYTAFVFTIIAMATMFIFLLKQKSKLFFILLVAIPLMFFTQIKNTVIHKNPVYPYKPPVLSSVFSNYNKYIDTNQAPEYLKDTSQFKKYFYSLFEINSYDPNRPKLWNIDQGDMPSSSKAFRMGGYFFPNIILWMLAVFILLIAKSGKYEKNATLYLLLVMLLNSVMPQSHELRYTLFIPILLFTLLLILLKNRSFKTKLFLYIIQIILFVFVAYNVLPIGGFPLPPYQQYDLTAITDKKSVCLYDIPINKPFLYRISTPIDVKIQYAGIERYCIYEPVKVNP